MQIWVVICGSLLLLVGADECPDAGRCPKGQTCCNSPTNAHECCPFDQVGSTEPTYFLRLFSDPCAERVRDEDSVMQHFQNEPVFISECVVSTVLAS